MSRKCSILIFAAITFGSGWFCNEILHRGVIDHAHKGQVYGKERFDGLTVREVLEVFGQPSGKLSANSFHQDVWFYSNMTLMLDARKIDGREPLGNAKRLVSRILIPQSCDPGTVMKIYEAHSDKSIVKKEIDILNLNNDGADLTRD